MPRVVGKRLELEEVSLQVVRDMAVAQKVLPDVSPVPAPSNFIRSDWAPVHPLLCAHHDSVSLASAWGLGRQTKEELALYSQSKSEAKAKIRLEEETETRHGDGKSNKLLCSCPGYRHEIGGEPLRHLGLTGVEGDPEKRKTYKPDETWHREHLACEADILEDVSNVYLGGRLCAERLSKNVIEPQPFGYCLYRHCFSGRPHSNFFGFDDNGEPIGISVIHDSADRNSPEGTDFTFYRMIIRYSHFDHIRVTVPDKYISEGLDMKKDHKTLIKELLEIACPQINPSWLHYVPMSRHMEDTLLECDEKAMHRNHKVGVMYCGANQCTEVEMYNNETGSPRFDEFLSFLGQKVVLKGFPNYAGGLDVEKGSSGEHSIYTTYQAEEVMFHVSTLLPFSSDFHQLPRKRHIGNDMVCVIFQDKGALPFTPTTVLSHFQRAFIVVRVNEEKEDDGTYSVAITRDEELPPFGPRLPPGGVFQKSSYFHDFLMAKIVNAEEAVARCPRFRTYAARNRRSDLKTFIEEILPHFEKPSSSFANPLGRLLGSSVKRKEKKVPEPILTVDVRGAVSWPATVFLFSERKWVRCVIGISTESIVILDVPSGVIAFSSPTHSIIGWAISGRFMRLYYDHGQMLMLMMDSETGNTGLTTLLQRLAATTKGATADEILYRRFKSTEPLGFNYLDEGVVTDVVLYRGAWSCGLRQGCRIVEIEGQPIIALTSEEIRAVIWQSSAVRLLVIPPAEDGSPRRGCEDPNCPAAKGNLDRGLIFEAYSKQLISYDEARRTSYIAGSPFGDLSFLGSRHFERLVGLPFPFDERRIPVSGHETSFRSPRIPRSLRKWGGSVNDHLTERCFTQIRGRIYRTHSEEAIYPLDEAHFVDLSTNRLQPAPGALGNAGGEPSSRPWVNEMLEKGVSLELISQVSRDKIRLEHALFDLKIIEEEKKKLTACVQQVTNEVTKAKLDKEQAQMKLAQIEHSKQLGAIAEEMPPSDDRVQSDA